MGNFIYIASPYTLGDIAQNVRNSMEAADTLIKHNYTPFIPLLFHFQHMIFPQPWEVWLKIDLRWITRCDAVLRLPGESTGADKEVAFALKNDIPVFYSIIDLLSTNYFCGAKDEIKANAN